MTYPMLDPDHPAFSVMDEGNDYWLRQLERIHPCFVEQERAAFRRTRFRREWMCHGLQFDVESYLKSEFPKPEPATVTEWLFLLRAWLAHRKPSDFVGGSEAAFGWGVMRFVTAALNQEMLQAIRNADDGLYRDFGIDLWKALTHGLTFEDRFHYHPGGCGIHQGYVNVRISSFDRFLLCWPVAKDPLLEPIWNEVQPWWNDWLKWMREHRSPWMMGH